MQIIFLCILAVASITHLVSLFFKYGIVHALSKACLLPLVAAIYIFGTNEVFLPVILALLFGWLGDIFLVKIKDVRFFRLGLASFLVGHIIYIPVILHFAGSINVIVLAISLPAALALGIFLYRLIRPSREMRVLTVIYASVILVMVISAAQLFATQGSPFGALVLAGSVCFVVSDTMLAKFTFGTEPRIGQFLVMLTYIAAQLCIALGLAGFPAGFPSGFPVH